MDAKNTINSIIYSNQNQTLKPLHIENLPGFRCGACGDSFSSEKILEMHMNRLSLSIYYSCKLCTDVIHFTNRCQVLLHNSRDHRGSKPKVLDCKNFVIKTLSLAEVRKKIDIFHERQTDICSFTMTDNQNTVNETTTKNTKRKSVNDQASSSMLPHISNTNDCVCNVCAEKFVILENGSAKQAIRNHFQRLDNNAINLYCQICKRILPNVCAFVYHQNLHKMVNANVCPECGTAINIYFLRHVNQECMHFYRCMIIKCTLSGCAEVINERNLPEHFVSCHSSTNYKCSECDEVFKEIKLFQTHLLSHNKENLSPKQYYECKLCPGKQFNNISTHAITHYKRLKKVAYKYFCDVCDCLYDTLHSYKCHRLIHKNEDIKNPHFSNNTKPDTSIKEKEKVSTLNDRDVTIALRKTIYPRTYKRIKILNELIEKPSTNSDESNESNDNETNKDVIENRCSFCNATFVKKNQLNIHFRLHGAAYLNTLKSK